MKNEIKKIAKVLEEAGVKTPGAVAFIMWKKRIRTVKGFEIAGIFDSTEVTRIKPIKD